MTFHRLRKTQSSKMPLLGGDVVLRFHAIQNVQHQATRMPVRGARASWGLRKGGECLFTEPESEFPSGEYY